MRIYAGRTVSALFDPLALQPGTVAFRKHSRDMGRWFSDAVALHRYQQICLAANRPLL
jgi:hypothetical protein